MTSLSSMKTCNEWIVLQLSQTLLYRVSMRGAELERSRSSDSSLFYERPQVFDIYDTFTLCVQKATASLKNMVCQESSLQSTLWSSCTHYLPLHLSDPKFLLYLGGMSRTELTTSKSQMTYTPCTHKKLGVIRGHQIYENGHQCDWFGPSYWLVLPHQGPISNLSNSWLELQGPN